LIGRRTKNGKMMGEKEKMPRSKKREKGTNKETTVASTVRPEPGRVSQTPASSKKGQGKATRVARRGKNGRLEPHHGKGGDEHNDTTKS